MGSPMFFLIVRDLNDLRFELVLLAGFEAVRLLPEIEAELADIFAVLQQRGQDF